MILTIISDQGTLRVELVSGSEIHGVDRGGTPFLAMHEHIS